MTKEKLRKRLKNFRARHRSKSVVRRLIRSPFFTGDAAWLFSQESNLYAIDPCIAFGRHLVLKIVDELLDEGEKKL